MTARFLAGVLAAALALGVPASVSAAPRETAAPVPVERGSITWGTCTDDSMTSGGWECGTLTVPLDWDDLANPADAEISFGILRSTAPDRLGAFTFNPGGPGGAGLGLSAYVRGVLPDEISTRFDIVAWDPRGVGESTPHLRGCAPQPDFPPLPDTGPVDWEATVREYVDSVEPLRRECFETNADIAPYLGTYYVIRDLEALRIALGEERWTYWGMSYGTRIGLRYAREYPTRFRAFLLDGSVAPNETMLTRSGQTAYKYGHVNATFTAAMGEGMTAKYGRVVRALNERTVTIDGTTYTRWQIFPRVYGSLGNQARYPAVRKVIDNVYAALFGTGASARRLDRNLALLEEVDPDSQGYFIDFVNCADVHTWPTVDEVVDVVSTAARVSSMTGAMDALGRSTHCFGLTPGFAPRWTQLTRPLALPTPPIVIQSYGDPATAWIGGRQMSEYFTGAAFLSYTGTAHVSYMRTPSACINDRATRYLLTQSVPRSATCAYEPTPPPEP
jgi:pimeloyl-ACP methyl ester carboxylesterase